MNYLEKEQIYFDYNATTPVLSDLEKLILSWLKAWGNPSSIHKTGRLPKRYLKEARQHIADFLKVSPLEIVLTAGGSEANNLAIKGVHSFYKFFCSSTDPTRNQFIYSAVEHPSVAMTMEYLRSCGAEVIKIPVNRQNRLDIDFYKKYLSEKTALVSIMFANNETGNIFPIKELAELAHKKGALFHCDGVQALGKFPIDLNDWGVDYCSFSAHKIYALKGCGVLYQKKQSPLVSLVHGGSQERRRRAGTENVLSASSLGYVLSTQKNMGDYYEQMQKLRNHFEDQVLQNIPNIRINGAESPRLPNTSSLIIEGVDGEILLMNLDIEGFAVGTGAACSSGSPEPSPVLLAMGLSREEAQSSLRISLGWQTTLSEINEFVKTLEKVVLRIRSLKSEYCN